MELNYLLLVIILSLSLVAVAIATESSKMPPYGTRSIRIRPSDKITRREDFCEVEGGIKRNREMRELCFRESNWQNTTLAPLAMQPQADSLDFTFIEPATTEQDLSTLFHEIIVFCTHHGLFRADKQCSWNIWRKIVELLSLEVDDAAFREVVARASEEFKRVHHIGWKDQLRIEKNENHSVASIASSDDIGSSSGDPTESVFSPNDSAAEVMPADLHFSCQVASELCLEGTLSQWRCDDTEEEPVSSIEKKHSRMKRSYCCHCLSLATSVTSHPPAFEPVLEASTQLESLVEDIEAYFDDIHDSEIVLSGGSIVEELGKSRTFLQNIQPNKIDFVDTTRCLQILFNVQLLNPELSNTVSKGASFGNTDDMSKWRHSSRKALKPDNNTNNDARAEISCHGSLQSTSWKPKYFRKHMDLQNFIGRHSNPQVTGTPVWSARDSFDSVDGNNGFYVVVYDYFACWNIAHLIDSVELFFSIAAAATQEATENLIRGVLLLNLESEDCRGRPETHIYDLVRLVHRSLLRYCFEHQIPVWVGNPSRLLQWTSSVQSDSVTNTDVTEESQNWWAQNFEKWVRMLYTHPNVVVRDEGPVHNAVSPVFPIVLDRPAQDVFTPDGVELFQRTLFHECDLSRAQNESDEFTFYLIFAERSGPRHVANWREVMTLLEEIAEMWTVQSAELFRDHSPEASIEAPSWNGVKMKRMKQQNPPRPRRFLARSINFAVLSPCDQLSFLSRTKLFLFVHGAEGAYLSLLPRGAIAVEMHPSGWSVPTPLNENNIEYMAAPLTDFIRPQSYMRYYEGDAAAARLRYFFFRATLPGSPLYCTTWMYHFMVDPTCGVEVIVPFLRDLLFQQSVPFIDVAT